jgi:uncharacterized protein (DUF1501 family)
MIGEIEGESVDRRDLLKLAAAPALLSLGGRSWAASADSGPKRLVVILLRGAVDGLNVVIPHGNKAYAEARPTIAIAPPGSEGGALPLDGYFGLNPALAGLYPLWRDKSLAFIHAAGSPDPTRSHFDAQLFIENGTPGHKTTEDGWMNRLLAGLPGPHGPTDAVSMGATLPHILRGSLAVANLPLGPEAERPTALDRPELSRAFDRLYSGSDAIARAYREGRAARAELTGAVADEMRRADNGAPPPTGFPAQAIRLARLLSRDSRIRLAFLSLGGWDTHINQGNHQGQLASHLRPLGDGLAGLAAGLGQAWPDTVVVVLSEFGRTVHENGDGGTDHGHGNVIWVMGGNIRGGQIYGEWPGLAPGQLYQRRDLAVTTDYRRVLAAIIERHLRLDDPQLARIFPDLPPPQPDLANLLAA